jgi:sugar phosphate isomerase/epimerase
VAPGERSAGLGANCLTALYLRCCSTIDALRAALDAVAGAGYSLTEISQPAQLSGSDGPALRRHAERSGLTICAVHAPLMRHDLTLAPQRAAAELAVELGAGILVVHASSLRFCSPDPTIRGMARERDLQRLDTLLRFCVPRGVSLGLENGKHPAHAEYLLSLLAALEGRHPDQPVADRPIRTSAVVGLVLDSGHAALRGGDPLQIARTMLPRLFHTHLHDNHGERDEHLPPGRGRIDWTALMALLHEGEYAGARMIELRPRRGWRPEQWQQALAEGRRTLNGV